MIRKFLAVSPLVLLFALWSTSALANDQIISTVENASGPQALIVNNGVPSGTIQLWYTYVGTSYPCGSTFATFELDLADQLGTTGKSPDYPVSLNLTQSGVGTPVQMAPNTDSFTVSPETVSPSYTLVNVNIDCSKLPIPYDGEEIVGNLNASTPSSSHLDTISTIQVHIILAFPSTSACLNLYSFETDPTTGNVLSSIGVTQKSEGVLNSAPSIEVDGLVVNTCSEPEPFDLGIGFNTNWEADSNGQPVVAYTQSGEVPNPTISFNLTGFGTGTNNGTNTCLNGVTLPAGYSYLVTVHSGSIKGTALPGGTSSSGSFEFSSFLATAGSSCDQSYLLGSDLVNTSNPATSSLDYSISNFH